MEALALVLIAVVSSQVVDAQIPKPCVGNVTAPTFTCCPTPAAFKNAGPCGANLDPPQGSCEPIATNYTFNETETDVRIHWPVQYFNWTCVCSERFGGFDCGECSFAYNDGDNCANPTVYPRKSVADMTDVEWDKYTKALMLAKTRPSRYMVETMDGFVNPTHYNMFVWMHHMAAKDNDVTKNEILVDFAHEGPGFPTWHRLLLLWLEREMQIEINDHAFRLPYWDWRDDTQRDVLFKYDRLGENENGTVNGRIFPNWKTACWNDTSDVVFPVNICNPNIPTDDLRRCPKPELCEPRNTYWPSYDDVDTALSIRDYDAPPFDSFVKDNSSFRNFFEGFVVSSECERGDTMCTDTSGTPLTLIMHNTVHIILGYGNVVSINSTPFNQSGVMGDVAASANDPVFVNHHVMVDCILEEWLLRNEDNLVYPESDEIREGHRADDYIVPFFPLYTQKDMLRTATHFGYSCSLTRSSGISSAYIAVYTLLVLLVIDVSLIIVFFGLLVWKTWHP